MSLLTLFVAALLQDPVEPARIVREIQSAVDRDGGAQLERVWRNTLRTRPRDPRAVLAVATFERNRYRYELADSLLRLLMVTGGADSLRWKAAAQLGQATWRALGSQVAAADTLFTRARAVAERAGDLRLAAEAALGLAQIRGRTQGPAVARGLFEEWWNRIPNADAVDSAVYFCSIGALSVSRGDTTSWPLLQKGLDIALARESWRVGGNCWLAMAQANDQRGFGDGTRGSANRALALFRRINYLPGVALAAQWYGYAQVEGQRFATGRALLEEAIQAARVTRFESVEAWARLGLARFFVDVGDLELARAYATEAAASHERRRDLWGIATSRLFEAEALAAAGDLGRASARFLDAYRSYQAAGIPLSGVAALVARAALQLRLGQVDSAARTVAGLDSIARSSAAWVQNERPILQASIALAQGRLEAADSLLRRSTMASAWRRGAVYTGARRVALLEALVGLRRGDPARVDSALKFSTTSATRYLASKLDEGYSSALAQLRVTYGGPADLYPALVAELSRRGRASDAFSVVEHVRARAVVERRLRAIAHVTDTTRALATLKSAPRESGVVTADELRSLLAADEAFVAYSIGLDEAPSLALLVTRGGIRSVEVDGGSGVVRDIDQLIKLAATGVEAVELSRRLAARLVQPVVDSLDPSIRRLVVAPDGALHRLPFDALTLRNGQRVLERLVVSTSPSATALIALRAHNLPSGSRVVAFGNPRYRAPVGRDATRGDAEPPFAAINLPRLVYSTGEVVRVASYGATGSVLTGDRASEASLFTVDLRSASVLHLAVHALVHPQSQEHTALALAPGNGYDGFVQPDELSRLVIPGSLVVLSACRSAGGTVLGGEGLRGLVAPFLEAGARAVAGTLWSIGDQSVVPFVDRFYAGMARGQRPDDALREAKLEAIRDGVSIADWGAFAITGDATRAPRLRTPRSVALPWARGIRQSLRDTTATDGPTPPW